MNGRLILRKALLFIMGVVGCAAVQAQNLTVQGVVRDASDNMPLPGVSVVVKNTTKGTITNFDGQFQLSVQSGETLVFSFIGYQSYEALATANMQVALESDVQNLQDVVVIGYGSVRKEDLTGSVVAIQAEELNRGAVTSAQDLLQSKVAGLHVLPGNGQPGGSAQMRIRSGASLNASNDPLVVIDGVPVSNDAAPGMSNALSAINPEDIETFTVLKDASATAIYGSRASNGVIIIQTKKGAKGASKLNVNYASTYSISDPRDRVEVLSGNEYRSLVTDMVSKGMLPKGDEILNVLNTYPEMSTDWQDHVYQTAFATDQNLSLSGNVLGAPFRVSFGYTNEDGTIKTSNFERYTLGVSAAPKFFDDHLTVQINLKGTINNNVFADGGAVGAAAFYDPTKPVTNDGSAFNGYWNWTQNRDGQSGGVLYDAAVNPMSLINDVRNDGKTKRSLGNLQLDYKFHFLPGLRANLNLGYDVAEGEGWNGSNPNSFQAAKDTDFSLIGQHSEWQNKRKNQLLEFYFNYATDLASIDSRIDVMAGYSWQHFWKEDYSRVYSNTVETGYAKEGWTYDEGKKAFLKNGSYAVPSENYLVSFFGRLNFSVKSRYLITATLRRDGSSRFSDDNRWGLFPSAAVAWTLSNEEFMESTQDWLSNLKLRAGFGVTGQQDVAENYAYIPSYEFGSNPVTQYLGTTLLKPTAYNKNLKWEETETTNIALDYGFLNNRINGSIEFYQKKTKDLLNTVDVASGTNFANTITANIGTMENRGVEFNINAVPVSRENFSWDLGFNITWNESTITKLTSSPSANLSGINVGGISAGTGTTIQKHMVDYTPYTFYTYQQVYDVQGNPIQNVFVDRNGDGQITEADRYLNHSPSPDYYFGFSSQFKYKNFDLGFNMHGSIGNYTFNDQASNNGTMYKVFDTQTGTLKNVLSEAKKFNFYDTNSSAQICSDLYLENASFLKLDNVTLGYSFKKLFTEKISGRISASVKNVFTITDYTGQDPENSGIDNDLWARPQIYTIGLNLNF